MPTTLSPETAAPSTNRPASNTPSRPNGRGPAGLASSDVRDMLDRLIDRLGSHAVFGEPVRHGDMTVIPVAEVRVGLGFGGGRDGEPDGGGGGGGGGLRVRPRGVVRIEADGVRFSPILDPMPIALAVFAVAVVVGRVLSS